MDAEASRSFLQELVRMDSSSQYREAAEQFWAKSHPDDAHLIAPEQREDSIAKIAEILYLFGEIERETPKQKVDRPCRSLRSRKQ